LPLELDHPGRQFGTSAETASLVPHDNCRVEERFLDSVIPQNLGQELVWPLEPIVCRLCGITSRRCLSKLLVERGELLPGWVCQNVIDRHDITQNWYACTHLSGGGHSHKGICAKLTFSSLGRALVSSCDLECASDHS
jgi:hypothetical protein